MFVVACFAVFSITTRTAYAAPVNCYDLGANSTAAALKACQDANPSNYHKMTPEDQVKAFLYRQAIRGCFAYALLSSGGSGVTPADASNGKIFAQGSRSIQQTGPFVNVYAGQILLGSQNEYMNCDDTNVIKDAFSLWGWKLPDALCDMGWSRDSDPNPANCMNASGNFQPPSTDGNALAAAFENALQSKFYGNNQWQLSDHQNYVLFRDTFIRGCAATPLPTGAASSGTIFNVDIVDGSGGVASTRYEAKADGGKQKYLYVTNDYDQYSMECGQLVDTINGGLNGRDIKGAYSNFQKIAEASAGGIVGGGAGSAGDTEEDLCDRLGSSSLRWVMCPLFTMMDGATSWIRGAIEEILQVDMETYFGPSMKNAWTTFRNISLTLLVIAALVMVISQAAGFDFLDAYTVKKILPRLLIAIIGITLSWELMKFTVQFFNDIGDWVYTIVTAAFSMDTANVPWTQDWGSAAAAGAGVALAGGAVAATGAGLFLLAVAPGGIGVIMATLGLFLLSLLIGLLVLGLRLAIIGACIIIAPLAIAAYVLPGTKKMWEFWKDTFWTCLILFPVMMLIMATCTALSSVIGATGTSWTSVLSLLVYFAQFMLLGLALNLVGGITKFLTSFATDKKKSWTGAARKFRSNSFGKVTRHHGDNMTEWRSKKLDHYQTLASRDGKSNTWAKTASWAVGGGKYGNIEARMSAIRAHKNKEMSEQIATGLDNEIRALSVSKLTADRVDAAVAAAAGGGDWSGQLSRVQGGVKQYKTAGGAWVKSAEVDAAHKRWKGDTAAQQKSLSYEMNKASHEEDVQAIGERYADLAKNAWGMNDFQAGGAWIGASYENQGKHRQLKSMNWQTGNFTTAGPGGTKVFDQSKITKFTDDVHENLGSYPLSQMNSETVRQLQVAYKNSNNADTKRKIQSIAETFMHDMAAGTPGTVIPGDGGAAAVLPGDPAGGRSGRQASTPGSAAMANRVRELADMTGVKWAAPPNGAPGPGGPTPVNTVPPQK